MEVVGCVCAEGGMVLECFFTDRSWSDIQMDVDTHGAVSVMASRHHINKISME